jgi:hypothetical protein
VGIKLHVNLGEKLHKLTGESCLMHFNYMRILHLNKMRDMQAVPKLQAAPDDGKKVVGCT